MDTAKFYARLTGSGSDDNQLWHFNVAVHKPLDLPFQMLVVRSAA
jgi:hypothetical protein